MSTASADPRLETPQIWIIALLPVVLMLTLFGANPLPPLSDRGEPVAGILRDVITTVVQLAGIVLAYFDSKRLKAEGFARPFGFLWTLIGGGVYVIGRCIVVNRRNGGALRPMWAWVALAALYVVLAITAILR